MKNPPNTKRIEWLRLMKVDSGKAVLVHCLAGEGRTGSVLAAYFIKYRGMGATEALAFLRERKPAFVERSQEIAVGEFARRQSNR